MEIPLGLLDGQFTLGVEEEFQIVHAETRELRSYVSKLLEEGMQNALLRERVRPEMHQSVVETGTGICRDIKQARARAPSSADRCAISRRRRTSGSSPPGRTPSATGRSRTSPTAIATRASSRISRTWPAPT